MKTTRHHKTRGMATGLACLLAAMLLTGCDRAMLRRVIDMLGHRDKSKPAVYHDYEGYSPGLRKSHVTEEFSRYHYYIAPDEVAAPDPDPDIYFRQDYDEVSPQVSFDEEQYWRDHPLNLDDTEVVTGD